MSTQKNMNGRSIVQWFNSSTTERERRMEKDLLNLDAKKLLNHPVLKIAVDSLESVGVHASMRPVYQRCLVIRESLDNVISALIFNQPLNRSEIEFARQSATEFLKALEDAQEQIRFNSSTTACRPCSGEKGETAPASGHSTVGTSLATRTLGAARTTAGRVLKSDLE